MKKTRTYIAEATRIHCHAARKALHEYEHPNRIVKPPEPKPFPESLIQRISEFLFDPDSELTFEPWFQKCEDIFRVDLAHVPEHNKVRLLLRKLGTVEHKRFINFILSKK